MPKKIDFFTPKSVRQIEELLFLFVDYMPTGLACFFGEEVFPGSEMIADILRAKHAPQEAGRVNGGQGVPYAARVIEGASEVERVIEDAGGLDVFYKVFTLFEAEKPQQTRLLREMSFIGRSFRYPSVEEFAFKNHMSTRQFYRVKSGVIRMIAWEVYRRGVMR